MRRVRFRGRMGELETKGGSGGPSGPGVDPPRGDEGLDDWFARRLEAQGIVANRAGFPTARIMAVVGLGAAVLAVAIVIFGTGGGSSSPTTTPSTNPPSTGSTDGGSKKGGTAWKGIKITILNGYGAAGAASTVQSALE